MQTKTKRSTKESTQGRETRSKNFTSDFRTVFKGLEPSSLITGDEFAALMCITRSGLDFRLFAGKLVEPAIQEKRCTRWRVDDVRKFLLGLKPQKTSKGDATENAALPRRGRPRSMNQNLAQVQQ